ncbi:hypothetical protein O181_071727 [Austropuccinia psidii MF-1]|uniref:C2H2-type domain-containing protein n=1 Tax=Austropuccinia psidii MF-1 TaxID=1389203 RepID=A0A9Q3F5Q5_9BASI|nr:hypothetical protein [Austropuccinia psidii MF-1]
MNHSHSHSQSQSQSQSYSYSPSYSPSHSHSYSHSHSQSQSQSHEDFFSFTVPPKPETIHHQSLQNSLLNSIENSNLIPNPNPNPNPNLNLNLTQSNLHHHPTLHHHLYPTNHHLYPTNHHHYPTNHHQNQNQNQNQNRPNTTTTTTTTPTTNTTPTTTTTKLLSPPSSNENFNPSVDFSGHSPTTNSISPLNSSFNPSNIPSSSQFAYNVPPSTSPFQSTLIAPTSDNTINHLIQLSPIINPPHIINSNSNLTTTTTINPSVSKSSDSSYKHLSSKLQNHSSSNQSNQTSSFNHHLIKPNNRSSLPILTKSQSSSNHLLLLDSTCSNPNLLNSNHHVSSNQNISSTSKNHAITAQNRPMTAPGATWAGGNIENGYENPSSNLDFLNHLSPPYPPTSSHEQVNNHLIPSKTNSTNHNINSSPIGPSTSISRPINSLNQSNHQLLNLTCQDHNLQTITHPSNLQLGSTSPILHNSALNVPSLGAPSSDSGPESPELADLKHSHHQTYLGLDHSLHHSLRPNTHAGTSICFGNDDSLIAPRSIHSRPATSLTQFNDLNHTYPLSNHDHHHFSSLRQTPFSNHSPHLNHHPSPTLENNSHTRLYNFNILPGAPRKRARRRFDEVERLYDCNYPGCVKAYGTLNHLNAHITMQKHGPKRLPQEFKEIRKEWRARKKAEAEARSIALKHSNLVTPNHPTFNNMMINPESIRPQSAIISSNSSPANNSINSFHHHHHHLNHQLRPSTAGNTLSAPAHFQHFLTQDRKLDWYTDQRQFHTTIEEHPEYMSTNTNSPTNSNLINPSSLLGLGRINNPLEFNNSYPYNHHSHSTLGSIIFPNVPTAQPHHSPSLID